LNVTFIKQAQIKRLAEGFRNTNLIFLFILIFELMHLTSAQNISMKSHYKKLPFLIPFITLFSLTAYSQHHHEKKASTSPLLFTSVLNQQLSSDLKDFQMKSVLMEVAPGLIDSVPHRHEAELFGYVLEGKVQVGMENKPPVTYTSGQMFYEKKLMLHSLLKNLEQSTTSKVLLIFIIKDGSKDYVAESAK
jgi:quercetin dioxygenase-like cupin family protein